MKTRKGKVEIDSIAWECPRLLQLATIINAPILRPNEKQVDLETAETRRICRVSKNKLLKFFSHCPAFEVTKAITRELDVVATFRTYLTQAHHAER